MKKINTEVQYTINLYQFSFLKLVFLILLCVQAFLWLLI